MAWYLHRRSALTVLRVLVAAAVCVYGAGIILNTVFPIYLDKPRSSISWWQNGNFIPLVGAEIYGIVKNMVAFLPTGFLIPLLIGANSVRRVALYGFLVSITMETIQFANALTGGGGHVTDINDLLANTLGALLGYGLFRIVLLVPSFSRLAAVASWPTASQVVTGNPTRAATRS
jgi:glycopeptide antibiotics resistance protein